MNATWIKSLALSPLLLAGLATGTMAVAGPITIDFNCSDGNGVKVGGGNPCTTPSKTAQISSWSQAFTGGAGPGTLTYTAATSNTGGKIYYNPTQGNPIPDESDQQAGAWTNTLTIAGNGAEDFSYLFEFDGIQIGSVNASNGLSEDLKYTITGWDGTNQEFSFSGAVCDPSFPCPGTSTTWYTIAAPGSDDTIPITSLTVTLNDSFRNSYEDNLEVTPTPSPEPSTLLLLGTGLLGLAFVAFRRMKSSGTLTLNS